MTYLLDTHAFLWIAIDDERMPRSLKSLLRDPAHDLYVSAASAWEIAAKAKAGKLTLHMPAWAFILESRERLGIQALSIQEDAVAHLAKLPDIHRDPFDRMLVCQAIQHSLTVVTNDPRVQRYPIKTLWAVN